MRQVERRVQPPQLSTEIRSQLRTRTDGYGGDWGMRSYPYLPQGHAFGDQAKTMPSNSLREVRRIAADFTPPASSSVATTLISPVGCSMASVRVWPDPTFAIAAAGLFGSRQAVATLTAPRTPMEECAR